MSHPMSHSTSHVTRSTLPLFPTDDGWPYPDESPGAIDVADDAEPDLDALDLRTNVHALDTLSPAERDAVRWRFGLDGCDPLAMRALALRMGCTRSEASVVLGAAIDKLREHLRET